MPISNIPFILNLDPAPYYSHNIYPNHVYRRLHDRHHDSIDLHTLGLIARLGPHAHQLVAKRQAGEMATLPTSGKNGFEVHLDVGLFLPEDLSVKVIDDSLVIEGKHDEREDEHGHISRNFVRRYVLPKGYDPEAIVSTLSSDGALSVHIPKPSSQNDKTNERIIQIQHTGGPSDLFLKSTSQDKGDENK